MESGRGDFIISLRSVFLKKGNQQKFSLLSLILFSIIFLILGSFNFKIINFNKTIIKEIIYFSSFIANIPENSIKKSIKLLEKTHKLLKKNNIDLSIVAFPQPSQILYDKEDSLHVEMLKNFCVERCKEFVNLYPIFFKFKNSMSDNDIIKKFYLKGDMHLNKEGNKIIAEKIIKDINF